MSTLLHTSSREADAALAVARIAAAGRVRAERERREERREALLAQGQHFAEYPGDSDWCYVCGRATDHLGEHSPEQIAAWREGWAAS